jgi:hypothetical protein
MLSIYVKRKTERIYIVCVCVCVTDSNSVRACTGVHIFSKNLGAPEDLHFIYLFIHYLQFGRHPVAGVVS